jgi:hypothetical protein
MQHYSIEATTGAWRRWAAAPSFAPDAERLREPLPVEAEDLDSAAADSELAPVPLPRAGYPDTQRKLTSNLRRLDRTARRFHTESKELHLKLHQRNLEVEGLQRDRDQLNRAVASHETELDARNRELLELHPRLHQLGTELQQLHQRLHQRNLAFDAAGAAAREELSRLALRLAEIEASTPHRIAAWLLRAWARLRGSPGPAAAAEAAPTKSEPTTGSGR